MRVDGRSSIASRSSTRARRPQRVSPPQRKGWPEAAARREIAGILQVLGKLHRGQTLHRDLTPMNVFVCDGPRLKLGDFGIVRQQSDAGGITAHTMNRMTAPSEMLDSRRAEMAGARRRVSGGAAAGDARPRRRQPRIRTADVRGLRCSDHLKEIVHRCIGERRKRYESADEMIEALRTPAGAAEGRRDPDAEGRAHRVHRHPPPDARSRCRGGAPCRSDRASAGRRRKRPSIVRGRPNPLQAAGRDGGLKLMEIKRLREKGQRIALLNETQFWRLAARR